MPPRRKLSDFDRTRAIAWLQEGVGVRQVAQRLQVSHSVIIRLRQRFHDTGSVQERRRTGRPKKTTAREDRYIIRQAIQDRRRSSNIIRQHLTAVTNIPISSQTTRNRLHEANLRACRPVRRPVLTQRHREDRRAWCTQHVRWNRAQWTNTLFIDESRFCLESADGRIRVWRRPGERFVDAAIEERNAFGGGSVMVWAGFSRHHRTALHHVDGNLNGDRYMNEILRPFVIPALQQIGQDAVFQDGNARPHRSRAVNDFLQQEGVVRMPWPANSPDLNPIEHLWDELGRRVRNNHPPPANRPQLLGWLQEEWEAIPQAFLARLVNSMRQRCVDCLASNGGHTRY